MTLQTVQTKPREPARPRRPTAADRPGYQSSQVISGTTVKTLERCDGIRLRGVTPDRALIHACQRIENEALHVNDALSFATLQDVGCLAWKPSSKMVGYESATGRCLSKPRIEVQQTVWEAAANGVLRNSAPVRRRLILGAPRESEPLPRDEARGFSPRRCRRERGVRLFVRLLRGSSD